MTFLLYGTGICALFLCDLLVTRFLPADEIALWAEARALTGILGTLAAGGLDLVMLRAPEASQWLMRAGLRQIPLTSLPAALLVWQSGFLSGPGSAVLLVAGSALTLLFAQSLRAHRRYLASQAVQQGWKLLALALIALQLSGLPLPAPDLQLGLAQLAVVLVAGICPASGPGKTPDPAPAAAGRLRRTGLRLMVMSLLLALAVSGEQLLVNGLSSAGSAAVFFTHATYFLFPVSILNGYAAFRTGPWIRDHRARFTALLGRYWPGLIAGALLYAGLMHLLGCLAWELIRPAAGTPDPVLQLAFLFSAFARTLYTLPSGYNGIFGSPRQQDRLIAGQILLLGLTGCGMYLLRDALPLLHLIAAAGAVNWLLRTAFSCLMIRAIHKEGQPLP